MGSHLNWKFQILHILRKLNRALGYFLNLSYSYFVNPHPVVYLSFSYCYRNNFGKYLFRLTLQPLTILQEKKNY